MDAIVLAEQIHLADRPLVGWVLLAGLVLSWVALAQIIQAGSGLDSRVPWSLARRLLYLPDQSRRMGIHLVAAKGVGKSRFLGRIMAWLDFLRGVPLVIFDPHGPTIDNFLDKIIRLSETEQRKLWPRVLYVDMSGSSGHAVVPFPLYYRLGQESLYEISQRYLDIIRKVDPWLMTASIEGFNALWNIGTYTGMVLAALGFQITEAESLIRHPKAWSSRFTQAIKNNPEARPAVDFFLKQYIQWPQHLQEKRSNSFRNKMAMFNLDPTMKAMFGADTPGIDWQKVMRERLVVLLDFRHEIDIERRRFKMLWALHYLLAFIKSRGAGRHLPISVVIDELSALTNFQTLNVDIFTADLDELINVIARNYSVWLTIAHQEQFQVDIRLQKTLMSMGTQIIGASADYESTLRLAQQLFEYEPHRVKHWQPVYWSSGSMGGLFFGPRIIDWEPTFYTPDEQDRLNSQQKVRTQGRFHFLVRPAPAEGDITGKVYPITIENFDQDRYVMEPLVAEARTILSKRCGTPVDRMLAQVQNRLGERQVGKFKRPRIPAKEAQT